MKVVFVTFLRKTTQQTKLRASSEIRNIDNSLLQGRNEEVIAVHTVVKIVIEEG